MKTKIIIIVVALLAAITGAYFLLKKKKTETTVDLTSFGVEKKTDIDTSSTDNPYTETEKATVKRLAKSLYADMNGVSLLINRDTKTYNEYLATSDKIFEATAKYFETNYGLGDNLATWLNNEFYTGTLSDTVSKIINRLMTSFEIKPE